MALSFSILTVQIGSKNRNREIGVDRMSTELPWHMWAEHVWGMWGGQNSYGPLAKLHKVVRRSSERGYNWGKGGGNGTLTLTVGIGEDAVSHLNPWKMHKFNYFLKFLTHYRYSALVHFICLTEWIVYRQYQLFRKWDAHYDVLGKRPHRAEYQPAVVRYLCWLDLLSESVV